MTEKQLTLTVNEQELNVLSAGIVELPYKVSAALIGKLQCQINEQQSPSDNPPTAAS